MPDTKLQLHILDSENIPELFNRSHEYGLMIENIRQKLPALKEASSHFGKHQSQFMDNFLTVSHPTPLRNARQILAEVNRSVEALKEAQFNLGKKQLHIKRLEKSLTQIVDEITKQEIELEIEFEKSRLASSMMYVEAAVRAVQNYTEQYNLILKNAGVKEMSEDDFEREEEKYHIMKAFDQAVCAARARGGLIDEGNHIYFSQIGVNGAMAQAMINRFFAQEKEHIERGEYIDHKFLKSFLEDMAKYFYGCSKAVADAKGMAYQTETALLKPMKGSDNG